MEWFKMSSRIYTDPDIRRLSPAAFMAWVMAMAWVADYESDGVYEHVGKVPRSFTELIDKGRLSVLGEGTYLVIGWDKWQRSKAELDEVRAKRAVAGKRGAKAKQVAKQTRSKAQADLELEIDTDVRTTSKARPTDEIPANPNPVTDDELYLARQLEESYGDALSPAAIQKLNTRYSTPIVSDAMRQLHGFPPADGVESVYAYVATICSLKAVG